MYSNQTQSQNQGTTRVFSVWSFVLLALMLGVGVVCMVMPNDTYAAEIDNWDNLTAAGDNDIWNSVTYGNGKFVAVASSTVAGGNHAVMYSSDGITWTTSSVSGDNDIWNSVTYGNGKFVAVGAGLGIDRVMYSSDGITWATTTAAGNNDLWNDITYGNGVFVAVASSTVAGGNHAVMYSSDGVTWTTATAAGDNDYWESVTYGNGRFVAVGRGGDRVMYSSNGIAWTTTTAAGNDDAWISVTYGSGRYVAVGVGADRVMYSNDGITWATTTAANNNDSWASVAYGNGYFVTVGDSGDRVMYSNDGITWATSSALIDDDSWNSITFGNGRFMVVGEGPGTERVMYVNLMHILSQTAFRFRADDGSEIAASYRGGQNQNVTTPTSTAFRLRAQIQGTSTPAFSGYKLQYQDGLDDRWFDVGVDQDTPSVVAATSSRTAGNAVTRSVPLPTCAAGNVLLAVISYDGVGPATTTLAEGWTKFGERSNALIVSSALFWKYANGNDTLNVQTALTEESSHVVYCIANAGAPSASGADGSSTNSNPPIHRTGPTRQHLWMVARSGDAQVQATVVPTGYTTPLAITANTTGGASTYTAFSMFLSSTTDPGTFTSATEQWVAWTIAVPPRHTPVVGTAGMMTHATATGANNTEYGSIAWTNPNNARSSNNLSATLTVSSTTVSNNLTVSSLGFTIPAGATIVGIEAEVEKTQTGGTAGNIRDNSIRLMKNGTTSGITNLGQTAVNWTATTEYLINYGSTTELWGTTWTPADINNSGFGLAIAVAGVAAGANRVANIDNVIIRVHYRLPGTIALASSTFIASGAPSTTGQLITPGAIVATSTGFSAGRVTDDLAIVNQIMVATSSYTEVEWTLIATGTAATSSLIALRVVAENGDVLQSYTTTPLITIGSTLTPGSMTVSGTVVNPYGSSTVGANYPVVVAVDEANPALFATTTSAGGAFSVTVATTSGTSTGWRQIKSAPRTDWYALAYGDGQYIAVGSTTGTSSTAVMRSTDGIDWVSVSAADNNDRWTAVTYGEGVFMAVGSGPGTDRAMYSYDGVNWTVVSVGGDNDSWQDVAYGNGRFVAVSCGQVNLTCSTTAAERIAYSDDGTTWTTVTVAGNNDLWSDVSYGNGRFVVVGSSGDRVMYSNDGIAWVLATAAGDNDAWTDVAYGNGRFVAVGNGPSTDRVMYSDDGVTWAAVSAAGDNDAWASVTYAQGNFYAISTSGDPFMYSPDGENWTVDLLNGIAPNFGSASNVQSTNNVVAAKGALTAVGDQRPTTRLPLGFGVGTSYVVYGNATTSDGATLVQGHSGLSSLSNVQLRQGSLLVYNASSTTPKPTDMQSLEFYDKSHDNNIPYYTFRFATNSVPLLYISSDLITATGTTQLPDTMTLIGDWSQTGELFADGGISGGFFPLFEEGAHNITSPQYDTRLSVFNEDSFPTGVMFSPDGMQMYITGSGGDAVDEWALTQQYDITTATYTDTLSVVAQESVPYSAAFNDAGTKLYVVGTGGAAVDEWALSVPYDVSTGVYTDTLVVSSQETAPTGIAFNNTGTKLYVVGTGGAAVDEWALSVPYDVSTGVYTDTLSVSAQETTPTSIAFNPNGTRLYVIGRTSDAVSEWVLSVPFDVSTAVYGLSYSVATLDSSPYGLAFSTAGQDLFVVGTGGSSVYRWHLPSLYSGSFTASSSLSDISIGATKVEFANPVSVNDFTSDSGIVWAPTTTLSISGNVENAGLFFARQGQVFLTGSGGANGFAEGAELYALTVSGNYSASSLFVSGDYTVTGTMQLFSGGLTTINTLKHVASYNDFLSVSAQETSPYAMAFNATGTKLYVLGINGDAIDEWALSVPFDVSTGVYTDTLSVLAQESFATGFAFNRDGTKLYVVGSGGDAVDEWALSVPYDVSTGVYTDTLVVSSQETTPTGIAFNDDGTKLYVVGSGGDAVDEWALSVPFDVSTGVYTDTLVVSPQAITPNGILLSRDGTKLYVVGSGGDAVDEWTLRIPYDVSTGEYATTFIIDAFERSPRGIAMNNTETKFYVIGAGARVHEWSIDALLTMQGNLATSSSLGALAITGSFPVSMNSAFASTTSLVVATSGTLYAATNTMSVSGDFTNRGVFIPRGATTTLSGSSTVYGNLSSYSDFTGPDYGLVQMTGNHTFISNSTTSALTIGSNATVTAPINGVLSIAHNFTNNGTFINNGATTTLSGDLNGRATGTNALGNTVINARSQAQNWQALTPAGNDDQWNDVAYGEGRYVAVSQFSTERVMYSDDGINWTASPAVNGSWSSVAYGNGRFVAVGFTGANRVMYSDDGISWNAVSVLGNDDEWQSVTYGDGRFVAVAFMGNNRVMYSDDGITWNAVSMFGDNDEWQSVTYGNGRFVAGAGTNYSDPSMMYSDDGIIWASSTISAGIVYGLTYGNGRFVAVGAFTGDQIQYSDDGIVWTPAAISSGNWYDVTYGNGIFVAVGNLTSGDGLAYSYNGITWATSSATGNDEWWQGVGYGDGRFVALAYSGTNVTMVSLPEMTFFGSASTSNFVIATSSYVNTRVGQLDVDGNFENNGTLDQEGRTIRLTGVGKTVRGGSTNFSSSTGVTSGVLAIAGSYTSVGDFSTSKMRIENGASFTVPGDGSLIVNHDLLNSGTFINNGTTTVRGSIESFGTSTTVLGDITVDSLSHGLFWEAIATSSAAGNNDLWFGVTHGNGRFVAVGSGPDPVMYSDDGLTWATTTTGVPGNGWTSVTYGEGRFVAVRCAACNSTTSSVMYSDDGINWVAVSTPGNTSDWQSVTYGNGRFVAVANYPASFVNEIMYSDDGITWISASSPLPSYWTSVTFGNDRFVAVGCGVADDCSGGSSARAIYSFNGVNWFSSFANTFIWNDVTYGNGRFVAVSPSSNLTAESRDGITWQLGAVSGSPSAIASYNDEFVIVSYGPRATSYMSTVNISTTTAVSGTWTDVTYGEGRFVAVGSNGSNRIMTALPVSVFRSNATTTNLTVSSDSTLYASSSVMAVTGNYQNEGTLNAASSTFVFNGTGAQVATGTLNGTSSFNNLRIENTSGTGSSTQSVAFGAPVSAGGTFTMVASTSARFRAGTTNTFNNVDWQGAGASTSEVWLRSSQDGSQWVLDINGTQNISYVNVRDSDATPTAGGVTPVGSTNAGNNTNWNFGSGVVAQVWNATDWTLFDTITIQEENIDATLTDFPVYVNLADLSSTFWSTTPAGAAVVGTDIRVTTADNIEVPRELVFASSTLETGELHFRAPQILSTTDTTFKIWYNGTTTGDYAAGATYGREAVWSDYLAVFHLGEAVNNTAGGYIDSAGNYAGTGNSMALTPPTGKLAGAGQSFDGTNDYITIANDMIAGRVPNVTMSTWFKTASTSQGGGYSMYAERAPTGSNIFKMDYGDGTSAAEPFLTVRNDANQLNQIRPATAGGYDNNAWHKVTYAFSGTNLQFYIADTEIASTTVNTRTYTNSGLESRIGGDAVGVNYWSGALDELRIASSTHSAAWVRAEYLNQSTTTNFYAVNLVGVFGSSTISNNTAGQVSNAFTSQDVTDGTLYSFRVVPNSGTADATEVRIDVTGLQNVNPENFSNMRIVWDFNDNGTFDVEDFAIVDSGLFTANGQNGSITFDDNNVTFGGSNTLTGPINLLIVANWTAPQNGSFMTLRLNPSGLTLVDGNGVQQIFGSVSSVQHSRNNRGGGGGSSSAGGNAPAGAGDVGGGGSTGGENIGNDPDFFSPSSNSGSWSSGANAYDGVDGTYATTSAANNHSYSNHGFGIPGTNVIGGIIVKLELSGSTAAGNVNVQLSWDGGTSWTTAKTSPTLTTADAVMTFGSPSDLWGRTWSTSEFSNPNFAVRITGNPSSNTVRLDAVQVRVYHTSSGGGSGGGGGGGGI